MDKEVTYSSCIADWISGFIREKQSVGYKYYNESKWMRRFDIYWAEHGYSKEGLSQENLSGWLEKRECEGLKCMTTRISVIRQYSAYLNE